MIDITSYGASPDNLDNTNAIQQALNNSQSVRIPPGNFRVDAIRSVQVRSGTTLQFDGTLCAIPNDKVVSVVLQLNGVSDVTVLGPGGILGEKRTHFGVGPNRGGFCLAAINSSNIRLGNNLWLKEGFADGIYLQDVSTVTIDNVSCENNARNGMSIISGEKITVTNSKFMLTSSESPMPQAGIDIEPDLPSQSLLDITITGNQFLQNKGAGCYIAFTPGPNRARIRVADNIFNQHYKDNCGPPIGGRNTTVSNLLYACCRWIPGYDWWAYPTEFTE